MKRIILTLGACLLGSASVMAAEKNAYDEAYFQKRLAKQGAMASKVGGLVVRPGSGRFSIIQGQEKISMSRVEKVALIFSSQFKMKVNVDKAQMPFSIGGAKESLSKSQVTVGLFVIDDEKLPMSLVSLEERWAMVNVHSMCDGAAEDVVDLRLRRELARVIKSLFSVADVAKGAKVVGCAKDLDKLKADPIDGNSLIYMVHGFPSFGLVPPRIDTYKHACVEGWAPQPTNDVQKAVWDEVHALPTKPLTIEQESARRKVK